MKANDDLKALAGKPIDLGEAGTLYFPVNQLTGQEFGLYSDFCMALQDSANTFSRAAEIELLKKIAEQKIPNRRQRDRMVLRVIARMDELHLIHPANKEPI